MTSAAELSSMLKLALGTPETVNFKALYKLLLSIISLSSIVKSGDKALEMEPTPRRPSSAAPVGLDKFKKPRDEKHSKRGVPASKDEQSKLGKPKDSFVYLKPEDLQGHPSQKSRSKSSPDVGRQPSIEKLEQDEKKSTKPAASEKEAVDTIKVPKPATAASEQETEESERSPSASFTEGKKTTAKKKRKGEGEAAQDVEPHETSSTEEDVGEKVDQGYTRKPQQKKRDQEQMKDKRKSVDQGQMIDKRKSVDQGQMRDKRKSVDQGQMKDKRKSVDQGQMKEKKKGDKSDVEKRKFQDEEYDESNLPERLEISSALISGQDVDDIVKRIELLENDMSMVKVSSPSDMDPSIERLEKREKMLQKLIEHVEKEAIANTGKLQADIIAIKSQLRILPHQDELYKSNFPSWKMLEDAICFHPVLNENIKEVRKSINENKDVAQTSKFLGSPGPSDRLLETLASISQLLEKTLTQSQSGKESSLELGAEVPQKESSGIFGQTEDKRKRRMPEDEIATALGEKFSISAMSSGSGTDLGYFTLRLSKLADQIAVMHKEMDSMQFWKDKVFSCEEEISDLKEIVNSLRKELDQKDDTGQDLIRRIQMDMNEFQTELHMIQNRRSIQLHKIQLETFKGSMHEQHPPPAATTSMNIVDHEARIRTQQIQLQMNTVMNIVSDLQQRMAAINLFMTYKGPKAMGPQGVSTSSSPPPSGVKESRIMRHEDKKNVYEDKRGALDTSDDSKLLLEDRAQIQQAIARVASQQSLLASRLESSSDQQYKEIRKLRDQMYKMHEELMSRCTDLQIVVHEVEASAVKEGGLKTTSRPPGHVTFVTQQAIEDSSKDQLEFEEQLLRDQETSISASRLKSESISHIDTSHFVTFSILNAVQQKLMSQISNLRRRLKDLEKMKTTIGIDTPEFEAALLKRDKTNRTACLSCSKKVEMLQLFSDVTSQHPLTLPELPHLSPPRLRNFGASHSTAHRAHFLDIYDIPRQCGGSYTASSKPRRIHYYPNLGEALDHVLEPSLVKRVDIRGTDGHIYKGHVQNPPDIPRNEPDNQVAHFRGD